MDDLISRQMTIDSVRGWSPMPYDDVIVEIIRALPSAQPEITKEAVELYCRQRCLTVITNELFNEMKAGWLAQSEQEKGKWIVHPEVKNVYGGTYIECSQCGEKYVVQHMEDEKYCRNCGTKMEV